MEARTNAGRNVALLGPQHKGPILRDVVDTLGAPEPFVLVAAGWEEREAETAPLEQHLGADVENLGLWPACEAAFERDRELRGLMFDRHDRMRELARIYRLRLSAELEALRRLLAEDDRRRTLDADDDLVEPALAPAFEALRALDAHHLARVTELNDEVFEKACRSAELRDGRERVRSVVAGAGTLLVAGGHAGILYNRMRLFDVVGSLAEQTVAIGWSAGGMVMTDRLLLFHDSPPRGAGDAEVHEAGFGLASDIVVLPHAGSRLRLGDRARVSLLARRMMPAQVVALDEGDWVQRGADGRWVAGSGGPARELRVDGSLIGAPSAASSTVPA